jgi:predicted acetyltransferase
MVFHGRNLVMKDTIMIRYDLHSMRTKEEFRRACECFHHLNDPSDSNAICVLESKDELEANGYTRVISDYHRWFIVEKNDGAVIGLARIIWYQDRLDIGCYIIPSERGKGYAIEVVQTMGNSFLIPAKNVRKIVHAWRKLDRHKHTL